MRVQPRVLGRLSLGTVNEGKGGTATLKLVSWTIPVRYLRIWMTESSNTCDSSRLRGPAQLRGICHQGIYVGALSADGQFTDFVKHLPSRQQTVTWPSSVDPWHAASDMDESKGDQVGFDFFFHSGVTRGLPAMVPIAMLYSTPEDAAAEIAYLINVNIPSPISKWEKRPTGSTCCRRTTARCICNSPRRFTSSSRGEAGRAGLRGNA